MLALKKMIKLLVVVAVFAFLCPGSQAQELPGQKTGDIADDYFANHDAKDFAALEAKSPLTAEEREALVPSQFKRNSSIPVDAAEKLRGFTQEKLENLYGRLNSGPIPDGAFAGAVILPRGGEHEALYYLAFQLGLLSSKEEQRSLGRKLHNLILDPLHGRKVEWKDFVVTRTEVEKYAQSLWRGKTFIKEEAVLRNQVGPTKLNLFPAKVYCGQSFIDRRKQSIVIDYQFADDITAYYRKFLDWVATRKGVNIRDEIRMIRPGLYLGRAYMDGVFALNFVLYQHGADDDTTEECKVHTVAERP
jgi:hypothetical protein